MSKSPVVHSQNASAHLRQRSRVTNGTSLFMEPGIDGRSALGRRFRDVYFLIIDSVIATHGEANEGQRQIARRIAFMSARCEAIEAQGLAGAAVDDDAFGRMADRIGRGYQRLGIKPPKADGLADLHAYIDAHPSKTELAE